MTNEELVTRQQQLRLRSAELRTTLVQQTQVLKGPLALADQARAGLLWLYRNPQWPIGAVVVLVIVRPRRALTWGGRIWWVWKTYKRLQG